MVIKINYTSSDVYVSTSVSPVYVVVNYSGTGGGGGVWGQITGTLSDQTDLQDALDAKFDDPTGTTSQYLRGDGTLATFPSLTGYVPYTGATTNVDLGEYELKAGQIEFDQSPTGTAGVAVMRWNDSDGTLDLGLKGGNVTLQVGQEQVQRVVNKSGVNLIESAYQVVKVTSAQGQRLAVDLAQGNNDANSTDTIGIVTETINNNQEGFITTSGIIRGINTTGSLQGETWVDGDVIYLSPTIAGAITNIKPTAPNHTVVLGYVVYAHAVNGKIFVKCDNGYELGELHDVYVPTPSNNDGIFWSSANSRYQNNTVAGALGYTPVPATRQLTINGTAYDLSADRSWTVSSGGTTIYSGDGTLAGDRIVTSSGYSLTILGGKEEIVGYPTEQISLRLQGSTNAKNPYLSLKNTHANGKDYALRSMLDGTFDIFNITNLNSVFKYDHTNNLTQFRASTNLTDLNFYLGSNDSVLGLWLNGTRTIGNYAIIQNSGSTFVNTASGGNIGFRVNNADKMRLTAAGRLLLGTTTESTYLADINGTARVTGETRVQDNVLVENSRNALTGITISNSTSGTDSSVNLLLNSSAGFTAQVFKYSQTRTAYKIIGSGDFGHYNGTGGGDISFLNDYTSGKIKFASGGASTAQMTLTSAGRLLLGTTTESTYILDVNGTARVSGLLSLNLTNTAGNRVMFYDGGTTSSRIGIAYSTGIAFHSAFAAPFKFGFDVDGSNFGSSSVFTIGQTLITSTIPISYSTGVGNRLIAFDGNSSAFRSGIGTGSVSQGGLALFTYPTFDMFFGTGQDGSTLNSSNSIMWISSSTSSLNIGATSNAASAILQLSSTTKGFLPPRMTNAQRAAISSPAVGLMVYCTDTVEGLYVYKSTGWTFVI